METEIVSSLLSASSKWKTFSVDTRRSVLEKATSSAKTNNAQSQTARKALAESTRAFKKCIKTTEAITTDDQKAQFQKLSASCKGIVKSYQEEIDKLTKRCKASDNLVLDLYKGIAEAPDPAPLLNNSVKHLESMTGQVSHLLKGMEEMQRELESKDKNYTESENNQNEELSQTQKLLKEALAKNQKLEKQLSNAKSVSSSTQNEISHMSKEEKEELIELRGEVAEYELEFKTLKNQDITIKKLNTKIEDLVADQEEVLQNELKKAQEHLAQTEGRRATEALEREAIMARKLASLELELKAERAGSAATQAHLLEADEGLNEREAAWEAQRQILVDDADRLREQMYEFKRERDDLKIKSEALKDDGVIGRSKDTELSSSVTQMADVLAERKAYEAEVSELTLSISAMRDEMKLKDETMIKLQTSMQATIESLDNERTFLAEKVRTLETEISEAPSKESINSMRRELRILKKLEYNASDPEAEKETQEMIQSSANGDVNDLESVLMNKLRKVESDLVKERREKTNHLKQCEKLKQELEKNQKAKAESDALAARLEADLDKATAAPAPSMKTNGDIPIQTKSDPSTLEHILDPNMPQPVVTQATAVPVESFSAVEKINDDHSVATIVMAQRDRLRARCDALEAERDSFKRELQVQVSTTESLKSDNTKLYEKVRYLQSYNNSVGVHARTTASLADRDLDLEALEQRYEASVDPFRQFSRAERQRKVKEMSPMERTVFFVARTVLGSKEMRTVLFFYVLGMHLLVFFTTYHWSHGCTSVAHPDHIEEMHKGLPQME